MEAPKLLKRLSDSSKEALKLAYGFARSNGRAVSARDLLFGVSQQHYPESPVLELLRYFNIPDQALFDGLSDNPSDPSSSASFDPILEKSRYMPDEDLLESGAFEPEVIEIIQISVKVAEEFNTIDTPPLVRLADLFGALLQVSSSAQSLLLSLLSSAWAPYQQITDTYMEFLKVSNKVKLPEFFAQKLPRPSLQAVSGFGADTRPNRDLVGIGAEIDAFANLITARALQPPLAIGLFGDWGSGKTYFMQSLQERVHKITEAARISGEPQKNISIYKYVVQIEFNAWHYVEGELWASLVEHIFNNLQTRENERISLLEQRQQVWAKKIQDKRRQQRDIEEHKRVLEGQLEEKRNRVKELEMQRDQKIKEMDEWKAKDALEDVQLSKKDEEDINALLKDMGVVETYQSGMDFYNALTELRAVLEEGNALGLLLRRRGWGWTARLAVVLVSGPVISALIAWASQNQVPAVTNALLGISGFLSAATIVLRQGTGEISKVLQRVKEAQAKLDAKRNEVEATYAQRIAAIEIEISPIEDEYQKAHADEQSLAKQISDLEKEAREITPRRVLLDFIKDRVGSQDYRKWLGVPALIRRDFDQLSNLIVDSNKKFIEEDDGVIKPEDVHNINRIVLYIDDLDRCPPEKVAKVLQAVHLLLAFPLFVVVVAVDARWLSQSLQKYYSGLLAAAPAKPGTQDMEVISPRATPQDYLEKIFQVPFWVSSLSETARLSVVRGLVRDSLVQLSEVDKQIGESDERHTLIKTIGDKTSPEPSQPQTGTPPQVFYEPKPKEPLSVKPAGLDIEPDELKFMEDLKPLLGLTPRSVRRFVNVYWLMKSVALTRPITQSFISKTQYADYQQVLFLLAVLTGLPDISHDFFSLLCPRPMKGLDQVKCPQGNLKEVIDALQGLIDRRVNEGIDTFAAQRDLDRLKHWISTKETGSWSSIPTDRLSVWAPQIARFSYRMEHV